ncbi:MAG: ChaN family lipoprotein [Planctomycetota bacterium]
MNAALEIVLALLLSTSSGLQLDVEALADRLANADVVVLGEEHDNVSGHDMQGRIFKALAERRPDIVLATEMFERDVQGVLDDYLAGRIDEKVMLKNARPWRDYKRFYRPMVELARERGFDVIAANAPTKEMRTLAFKGADKLKPSRWHASVSEAPKDRYWKLFQEAMADHAGVGSEDSIYGVYKSQCMKDDTMAESIVEYLDARPYRRPLVVFLCGKFHSEYGLGTVSRILKRRPLTRIEVCTMVSAEDPTEIKGKEYRDRAHYIFAVPAEPEKEKKTPSAKAKKDSESEDAGGKIDKSDVVSIVAPSSQPTSRGVPTSGPTTQASSGKGAGSKPKPPVDPDARPALGFMPQYENEEDGVAIATVVEGGPLEAAGLQDGDLITAIGKAKLIDLEDYMNAMEELRPGQKVKVTYKRNGKLTKVDVTVGSR